MSNREMKKLPIVIDNQIFLRSVEQMAITAVSKILGARHGDFILIEQPVFRVSERLYATPQEFLCSFSEEGDVYQFRSKIQRTIGKSLTFIDYPQEFKIEALRKHHRIQVNIEARIHFPGLKENVKGIVKDVSEGGCFASIPVLIAVTNNMPCVIDFTLPDNQAIAAVTGVVRQVKFFKLRKTIDLGLEFTGPADQLNKLRSFCRYCMFFKV